MKKVTNNIPQPWRLDDGWGDGDGWGDDCHEASGDGEGNGLGLGYGTGLDFSDSNTIVKKKKHMEKTEFIPSNLVIVRTYSAGVHVGELVSQVGTEVVLKNARRIWRWRGANTLNEVSLHGVVTNDFTRISEIVPEIKLTEGIEIIPVSEKAALTMVPVWN